MMSSSTAWTAPRYKIPERAEAGRQADLNLGPPDPDFAREQGLNWFLRQVLRLLSFGIRRKAKGRRISLFVPVHARERRAVEPDHIADRGRDHSPRHGPGLPLRRDQ